MPRVQDYEYTLTLRDQATQVWNDFQKNVELGSKRLEATLSRFAPLIAGAFSGVAIKQFVDASNEAELASKKLDAALAVQGDTTKETRAQMEAYSKELENVTTFSDEAITQVQALLVSMTGLTGKAVQPLTKAALDLSAGLGIDAEQAARLIARTEGGSDALKRMGIEIGKTRNEQERLEKITAEVEKRFGGMAEAVGNTAAGKLKQFQNQINDLEERFGFIVKQVIGAVLPAVEKFVKGIEALPVPIQASILAVGALTSAVLVLNASLLSNPITLVLLGIAGAAAATAAAMGGLSSSTDELAKKSAELTREQDQLKEVSKLADRFDALSGKVRLTSKEKKELSDVMRTLAGQTPEAVKAWDDEGNAIAIDTKAVRENLDARRDYLVLKEKEFIQKEIVGPLGDATAAYEEHVDAVQNARKSAEDLGKEFEMTRASVDLFGVSESKADFIAHTMAETIRNNQKDLVEDRDKITQLAGALSHYVSNVKDFAQVAPILRDAGMKPELIEDLRKRWGELTANVASAAEVGQKSNKVFVDMTGSLKGLKDEVDALDKEFRETKGLEAQVAAFKKFDDAQNKLKALEEDIARRAKGLSLPKLDIKILLGMEVNEQSIQDTVQDTIKRIRNSFGKVRIEPEIDFNTDTVESAVAKIRGQFGKFQIPPPDPAYLDKVSDQAKLEKDLRLKSFNEEKSQELSDLEDWYQKSLVLAHDNEEYIARMKQVYAEEVLKAQKKYVTEQWQDYIQAAQKALSASLKLLLGFSAQSAKIDTADLKRKNELADIQDQKERDTLAKQLADGEISRREYELRMQELAKATSDRQIALNDAYAANSKTMLDSLEDVWSAFWDDVVQMALQKLAELAVLKIFELFAFHEGGKVKALGSEISAEPLSSAGLTKAHTGMFIDAPPSREFPILVRGGETIRTEGQEASVQKAVRERDELARREPTGAPAPPTVNVTVNFNSPVPHSEWVKKSIEEGLRATGLTVDKYLVNQRQDLKVAR